MDKIGNIFYAYFLGYTYWFMAIRISHLKHHYISVDQARYATSVFANYLDNSTIKESSKFHNNTLPHDMIFTK